VLARTKTQARKSPSRQRGWGTQNQNPKIFWLGVVLVWNGNKKVIMAEEERGKRKEEIKIQKHTKT
jgi:hypothetical protein